MAKLDLAFGWVLSESKNNYHIGLVREALSALDDGARRCSKRIDDVHASGSDEYADMVTDEECDVLETLLGSAFTVCQTHIVQVVADVHRLHRIAARTDCGRPTVKLTTTTTKKADVMARGCPCVTGTATTVIEALNALANYFKHRDEWPHKHNWTKATGQAVETVRVLTAIGLEPGSTGNLRRGAEVLGNTDLDKMNVFANLLEDWHVKLMADYEQELRSKGLIK